MRVLAHWRPADAIGAATQIVEYDTATGGVDVVAADPRYSLQAPKQSADGKHRLWYRTQPGGSVNLTSVEIVIDGTAHPTPKGWGRHGHAVFVPDSKGRAIGLIHAVEQMRRSLWWWPLPVPQPWQLIRTDLAMRQVEVMAPANRAEPSNRGGPLVSIDTATQEVVTPRRTFPMTAGVRQFDPHLSLDGTRVVWLRLASWNLFGAYDLVIGDVATGDQRTIHIGKAGGPIQTDALWLTDRTLLGSRRMVGDWHFTLGAIDADTGEFTPMSDRAAGSIESPWPI